MVHEKTVWFRFLTIFALAVGLWFCISGRVEAEEEESIKEVSTFTYNGVDYTYYYFSYIQINVSGYNRDLYFDAPVYGYRTGSSFCFVSQTSNCGHEYYSGSFLFNVDFTYDTARNIYVGALSHGSSMYGSTLPDSGTSVSGLATAFYDYVASDDFVEYRHTPVWRSAKNANSSIKLKDFTADLTDDAVVGTWDGIEMGVTKYRNLRSYVNTYVRLTFGLCPIDETDESLEPIYINYPNGVLGSTPYTMFSNGFDVPLSELAIPETHRLWFVQANPYFYENDDINGQLMACNYVQVYFDENGDYLSTETKQPHSEYREEEPEKSIWDAVTDFSTNIGDEIAGALEYAFIPSGDDVLAVLNEMNDWFSERFGFIWYPFDLAIDIVAAFALGEADSMFTVPALELNMFGGVTLWEEFQTDLDAFGYLHYVRFFTSAILAMSTVSLAVKKFDEWIGGKKS